MTRVALLLACVMVAGCGEQAAASESARVRAVYSEYVTAIRTGNGEKACGLLTPEAHTVASSLGDCAATLELGVASLPTAGAVKHMAVTVHGDTATYRLPGENGTARRINGQWRIGLAQ